MFDKILNILFRLYEKITFFMVYKAEDLSNEFYNDYMEYRKDKKSERKNITKEEIEQQEKAYNDFVQ
ncbi:MAG: hypothetical protein RR594_07115, partial [Clostridia bacterium]